MSRVRLYELLVKKIGVPLSVAFAATSLWLTPAAQERGDCFIYARLVASKPFVSNANECRLRTAPASTFKIPHALIALQAGVITPQTVFTWDGTPRDFATWQRDHTLDSAMKWSVLPFFQRTARLIGPERMRRGLSSLGYASDTFDGDISLFWLNGDLVVSPLEQFAFLRRLFSGTLPIPARHVSAVKDAIRMPPGRIVNASGVHPFTINWPSTTIVRAKTGNTTVEGEQVSWLVGALELNGIHHVFVARVRSTGALERAAATDLAVRGLHAQKPPA